MFFDFLKFQTQHLMFLQHKYNRFSFKHTYLCRVAQLRTKNKIIFQTRVKNGIGTKFVGDLEEHDARKWYNSILNCTHSLPTLYENIFPIQTRNYVFSYQVHAKNDNTLNMCFNNFLFIIYAFSTAYWNFNGRQRFENLRSGGIASVRSKSFSLVIVYNVN